MMRRRNQFCCCCAGCSNDNQSSRMGETPCETVPDCCGGTMNIYRMSSTPWYPCAPGSVAADILCARQEEREACGRNTRSDGGCPSSGEAGGSRCGGSCCSCGCSGNTGCEGMNDLRNAVERCEAAAREACEAAREANQAACDARESACESRASAERAERAACESCECAQAAQNTGRCCNGGANGSCRCNGCRQA